MVFNPFTPLIGQSQAVELLQAAIARQRIAPGYLFVGASGIGRRLAAQCFLELLLCPPSQEIPPASLGHRIQQGNHPDLFWVEPTFLHQGQRLTAKEADAAGLKRRSPPQIRLEQIRDIARFLSRPPLEAPRSVVVLEGTETMAEAAANGLLKTLEEPGQATLILIAPSVDTLLPTIVSRCQRIPFVRLRPEAVAQVLTQAGQSEILNHPEILAMAQGSPGEAIACWQQWQEIPSDLLSHMTQSPASLRQALHLAHEISQTLSNESQLWLVDYLQQFYWQKNTPPSVLHHLEQARRSLRAYVQPRLVWEVTLMAMVG